MRNSWRWMSWMALSVIQLQGPTLLLGTESALYAQDLQNLTLSSRLTQALEAYQAGNYEQSIAQWRQLLNDPEVKRDRLRLGQVWNYLSLGQQKLAQWEAASQSIRKSLGYLAPGSNRPIANLQLSYYAQALTAQGQLYLEVGREEEAVKIWESSEALYRSLDDKIGVRGSLMNQALALEQSGFYRRACFTILEAVEIKSQCDFSDAEEIQPFIAAFTRQGDLTFQAIALHTFSKILQQLGTLDAAEQALARAMLLSQQLPHLQPSLNVTEVSFAISRYQLLKQEESRARTRRIATSLQDRIIKQAAIIHRLYQSLRIPAKPTPFQYPAQVDYLSFLIDHFFWIQQHQLVDDSIATALREQILQLKAGTPVTAQKSVQYARIKHAESLIDLLADSSSQSLDLETQIVRLLQPLIQPSNNATFARTQTQAFAYGALGRFYEIKQQWPQAQQATHLAISHAPSLQQADVFYRWQWQLGRILAAQGQSDRAIQAYEQALIALQTIRQDLLSLKRNAQLSFRDQIEPSYRELVELLLRDARPSPQQLSQARRVIDRLQVSEVEDFLLQNCITASLATLDSYLERQAPRSALIYTIVQDNHLDIIVKIPGLREIQFHRVFQSRRQLDAFLQDYRRSLQAKLPSAQRDSQRQGQQLYQWLVDPFKEKLQERQIDTLVFVLDGGLRDIPMATLHTGQRYLIQDYAIAVTPGLQVLEASRPVNKAPQALVAGASEGDRALGLPALPAVKHEVQKIQSTLAQTEVLLDSAFTANSFQSSLQASPASIIHIATHGQFSSNPAETFIVTGNGERLDIDQLGNLLRQRTRAQALELLFLSACQTLAGDRWAALGMAGMAIRSGAQSTIASIWNADDEAAAELVTRFYQKLTDQSGRTKAEALRLAQIDMLQNPRYHLPVYWSPYVLIGNWQ